MSQTNCLFRYVIAVALALASSAALTTRAFSQEQAERTLSRAQSLYYEARFKDSIDLLLPVDATLRQQPGRRSLSISVKLQLALGYIGQNETAQAKALFEEVCLLDPEYALDSNEFAPKVIALFDDAKAEQKKARCEAFCGELDRLSKNGDVQGLLRQSKQAGDGCLCAAAADAADLLYRRGVEAYKREDFAQAGENFRAALKFRPQHDLASQYAELAESKADLTLERMVFDWRKYFAAEDFAKATTAYRRLESSNIGGRADALEKMRGEYRTAVNAKVESWNQSCWSGSRPPLDTVRQQITDLLPNETIAADLVSTLSSCAPKTADVSQAPPESCLQMPSQLALVRLKSRVNPDIPPERVPSTPVNMSAKVKIDESGNVTVKEIAGPDPYLSRAMRTAIEKWKFVPTVFQDQRRCVETDLPILFSRS